MLEPGVVDVKYIHLFALLGYLYALFLLIFNERMWMCVIYSEQTPTTAQQHNISGADSVVMKRSLLYLKEMLERVVGRLKMIKTKSDNVFPGTHKKRE